jgi:translocation protein SEC66
VPLQELRDVVMEANAYKEGWGQVIFQTGNEMVNHDRIRERAEKVTAEAAVERKWWDEKRERTTRELLGDSDSSDGVIVEKKKK